MTASLEKKMRAMERGGCISAKALSVVLAGVKPGITTLELNNLAEKTIVSLGGTPSFKTVKGYNFATCINTNEGIVHGLPGAYELKRGDLISIDLGTYFAGFHTDTSHTVEVETKTHDRFLSVGKAALDAGILCCLIGGRIGDISNAIQDNVEHAGYSVSRDLVGHGVGKKLHEYPHVPGYGKKGQGEVIRVGMTLAIEVIYQTGKPEICVEEDGWTLKTADGSISGLFEHTVAVTKGGPKVLTRCI